MSPIYKIVLQKYINDINGIIYDMIMKDIILHTKILKVMGTLWDLKLRFQLMETIEFACEEDKL